MSDEQVTEDETVEDEEGNIEEFKEQIEEKDEKIGELESLVKRVKADFENYKKNNERLEENYREKGKEELLKELFDPLDSLRSALELEGSPSEGNNEEVVRGLYEGLESVLNQVEGIMSEHGVEIIYPGKEEDFDPEIHKAVSVKKSDDGQDGEIVEVLQVGYKYNGKLLRPAVVSVYEEK